MFTTESITPPPAPPAATPRLQNGDRLTRDEFERRYEATPDLGKAELIEGVVVMPSPVRTDHHGEPHTDIGAWAGIYRVYTPGVRVSDNGSIRLDTDNMPQPDVFVLLAPACGGQARVDDEGYVDGAPELIVEVAASSVSYDLYDKMNAYRRNGVREYVVWRVLDREVDWFVLRAGRYQRLTPGEDGIHRSEVLPGLWLDAGALVRGDLRRVHEVLSQGLASPEHTAFAARNAAEMAG